MPHFADGVYQYGGMPVSTGGPFGMNSKYFFVDTESGSNGNDGLTPDHAKASITSALAQCVADRRDTIYVLRWGTDNSETWPIPMSVAGVSLIGIRAGSMHQSTMAFITAPGSTAVVTISAARCRVVNCFLSGHASYDAITFTNVPGQTGIIGCWFGTCLDAIGGGAGATTSIGYHSEIVDNIFDNRVLDHGIYQYNPAFLLIKGNRFVEVGGTYVIELRAAGSPCIFGNRFGLHSDVEGSAIRLVSQSINGVIDDNRANCWKVAMVTNPYWDQTPHVPNSNMWLLNYAGIVAVLPVQG